MGTHGKVRARESAKKLRADKQRRALDRSKIVKAIRKWGDPILKEVCEPVELSEWSQLKEWVALMIKTLKATKDGVGLAAPQIGIKKNVVVYRTALDSNDFKVLVNPLVIKNGLNSVTSIEGCLSYPGYTARVNRYDDIEVSWKDLEAKDKKDWLKGRDAIIFQHENDHLSGVCKVGEEWEKAMGLRAKDATSEVTSEAFFGDANVGAEIPVEA